MNDKELLELIKEVINKKSTNSLAKLIAYDNIVNIIKSGESK